MINVRLWSSYVNWFDIQGIIIQKLLDFNKNVYKWRKRCLFLITSDNQKKQKALMAHLPPAQSQVEITHAY